MFGKQSKDELSKMLQERCDHALLLDNTIHTLYASQPKPSKSPYRQKKKGPDAFSEEVARLAANQAARVEAQGADADAHQGAGADVDVESLEKEVAAFMRGRGGRSRK